MSALTLGKTIAIGASASSAVAAKRANVGASTTSFAGASVSSISMTQAKASRGSLVIRNNVYEDENMPTGPLYSEFGGASNEAVTNYFKGRTATIHEHYPEAFGQDDFLARAEVALNMYGFNGDNTIAMANMCRDEITTGLRVKIEDIFGICFSTNGLGGVLTCGATGIGAGISHAPLAKGDKEKYVFFAFPHTAINSEGEIGVLNRPDRPGPSCACGALAKALGDIKSTQETHVPGSHDVNDPEMSILYHRLARRIEAEGWDVDSMDLVDITKVAAALINDDLEFLLSKVVDVEKADYAVITGTQIHNWSLDYYDDFPNLEYLAPYSCYAVVDGKRHDFNLEDIPGPTARQTRLLAAPVAKRAQIDRSFRPAMNKVNNLAAKLQDKAGDGTISEISEFDARPANWRKWKRSLSNAPTRTPLLTEEEAVAEAAKEKTSFPHA